MSVTICVPPAFWLSLASNALRIIPSSVRSAGLEICTKRVWLRIYLLVVWRAIVAPATSSHAASRRRCCRGVSSPFLRNHRWSTLSSGSTFLLNIYQIRCASFSLMVPSSILKSLYSQSVAARIWSKWSRLVSVISICP